MTALGLAAGVGLVMAIVGVSQGLAHAQDTVLSPLRSVGTDILVTRTVGATSASASASPTPTPTQTSAAQQQGGQQGRGGGFFATGPGDNRNGNDGSLSQFDQLNAEDQAALLEENSSVITDLSKLGPAGTKFTHDFFIPGTLISFPDQAIATVAGISGVESAVGGLSLQAQHETGTVPRQVATFTTGGQTLQAVTKPAPLTAAEQTEVRACFEKNGGFGSGGSTSNDERTRVRPTAPPSGDGDGRPSDRQFGAAFDKCLPARFQEYRTQVQVPLQTIQQVVNPPSTDTTSRSYTAAGVDPSHPDAGLITKAQIVSGTWFAADKTKQTTQVLVNAAYANTQKLKVGDTVPINGTNYTVIGTVAPTLTGNVSDLYFTLPTMQKLADKSGRVNEVLVKADSSANVDAVAAAIQKALPGAQVVTAKSLADQVTGSLSDARSLADRLGGALAVIVLLAAFLIAVLLTLSSVTKRVREIGTLRALGWSRGRVVRQIVGETLGIGVVGGAIGLGVGALVCWAIGAYGPALNATSSGVAVGDSSVGGLFGSATQAATTSVVHLSAPIGLATIGLGILVALIGGLIAGGAGGWRASRLAPAVALRDLG